MRPAAAALAALAAAGFMPAGCDPGEQPLRIGMLLPASGPSDLHYRREIEWALDNLNRAASRPLGVRVIDIGTGDVRAGARALIDDPTVVGVVGPDTSGRLFQVAPLFVAARKPIVSPGSTAADIFRAFAGQKAVWRTIEPDVAQTRILLTLASRRGARRVGLVSPLTAYGNTFFDWFGFFAAELRLEVADLVRYDQGTPCDAATRSALAAGPDVLVAVPTDPEDAVCLLRAALAAGLADRLLFSDVGYAPHVIAALGAAAEGIEGTTAAWARDSGFEQAHRARFGELPTNYAANTYDAAALIAYGLERSGGRTGEALLDSMTELVDVRGGLRLGWDTEGAARALASLRAGQLPRISGATGPLEFDAVAHTDLTSSTYMHWRVAGGQFQALELFDSAAAPASQAAEGASALRTTASSEVSQDVTAGGVVDRGPRAGMWALIAATSRGWANYRHQADALAYYQLLRRRGVSDDRIVLIIEDDLASSADNPLPGIVRHAQGGPDVRAGAVVDYRPRELAPQDLMDILAGRDSPRLPAVIDSGAGDDVLVFVVGHGGRQGLFLHQSREQDVVDETEVLTPAMLGATVADMAARGRYRRMLFVVEACRGGVLGSALSSDGVLLMSGANPFENSVATHYDPELGQWLADDFASRLAEVATGDSDISLAELYKHLYLRVAGSHVFVANQARFGDARSVPLSDFVTP
jgi:ABC-type branched-subunit amino acid transport system substrate-binding protein/glycosylphosphatidylinositol transamidase (GPIT) subunit GPI8